MAKQYAKPIGIRQFNKIFNAAWKAGYEAGMAWERQYPSGKPAPDPVADAMKQVNKGKLTIDEAIERILNG